VSGVRGRRITALVAAALLALAAAGCGGGEPLAPEVPGPPAEVKIPQASQAPGDAAAAQNAAGNDSTGTSDSTTGTGSSGDTGTDATPTPTPAGTGTDQGGGAAAPDATADSPTNDTPPPDGSNAQQFEDFCAQNPGAC
jgi:hypothetical protein